MNASVIITQPYFNKFLAASKSYCLFIEESTKTNKAFLLEVQNLLITLYAEGRHLPATNLIYDEDFNVDLSDNDIKDLLLNISKRTPFGFYSVALNPFVLESKDNWALGDFTDDLGDIYKDIKEFITLFDLQTPASIEAALWKINFSYTYHWEEHCIDALHTIKHYFIDFPDAQ